MKIAAAGRRVCTVPTCVIRPKTADRTNLEWDLDFLSAFHFPWPVITIDILRISHHFKLYTLFFGERESTVVSFGLSAVVSMESTRAYCIRVDCHRFVYFPRVRVCQQPMWKQNSMRRNSSIHLLELSSTIMQFKFYTLRNNCNGIDEHWFVAYFLHEFQDFYEPIIRAVIPTFRFDEKNRCIVRYKRMVDCVTCLAARSCCSAAERNKKGLEWGGVFIQLPLRIMA